MDRKQVIENMTPKQWAVVREEEYRTKMGVAEDLIRNCLMHYGFEKTMYHILDALWSEAYYGGYDEDDEGMQWCYYKEDEALAAELKPIVDALEKKMDEIEEQEE